MCSSDLNGKESILKYKPTRNAILYWLLTVLITFCIYLISFQKPDASWLVFLGAIAFLFTGIHAVYVIINYQKWKASVEAYLKDVAQYKSHELKLTSAAIELIQDSTITIEKWEQIKSVQIKNGYIMLFNSDEPVYIFPAKSMQPEEFTKMKDFIIDKMMIPVEE